MENEFWMRLVMLYKMSEFAYGSELECWWRLLHLEVKIIVY